MKIVDNRVKRNIHDLKSGDVVVFKDRDYYMLIEDTDGLYEQDGYFGCLLVDLEHGTLKTIDYNHWKDFKLVKAELHIE